MNKLIQMRRPISMMNPSNGIRRFTTISNPSDKLVLVSESDGVRNIVLNSPKSRNALSLDMMNEMLANIREDRSNKNLRCIIISANGPVFSAGHNLKEFAADSGEELHRKIFEKASELMLEIVQNAVPVLSKVDGLAAAAGCQLIASCDIVVATNKSTFSTPGVNFGIFCSTPGIALARTISQKQALYMLLTGNAINAKEALQNGLITRAVECEVQLDIEINKFCEDIKSKSRNVIRNGKRFFHEQNQMTLKAAYKYGENEMINNIETWDGQEGIRSFIEKRKPKW